MFKLLCFQFRVTISNLKNMELNFELRTWCRLILETQCYPWPKPLHSLQEKTSVFFWSPTISNYHYIIISCCSRYFSPTGICRLLVKLDFKIKFSISICRSTGYQTKRNGNLFLSSESLFRIKIAYQTNSTHSNGG